MRMVHQSAIALAAGIFTVGLTTSLASNVQAEVLIAQITSTSQIADVDPSADYYPALSSLIERYGITLTYADSTFRANDVLTYGEFALGLNQALDSLTQAGWTQPPQPQAFRTASVVDVERTSAYFEAVELLNTRYNVNLAAGGEFDGNLPITRQAVADYINQATGLTFDGSEDILTRGEFAILLDQMLSEALAGM